MTKEITYIKSPVPPAVVQRLVRPEVAAMEPYTPIVPFDVLSARLGRRPDEIVKLDANENPYGPSPRALRALAEERYYHIYPDPDQRALREAIARYVDVSPDFILAGAGADELIDLLMRLFIGPGDGVIDCPPTFGMYEFDAALQGGIVFKVPRRDDFSLDLDAIEEVARRERPKLIFITSPNNPDGSIIAREELHRLLQLPLVVVLDEAYAEFSGQSFVSWVLTYPNLVVLRTFSKWAGLAGLRVGYGVFPSNIIQHLWKIKQPYNVNVAATRAAIASLDDADHLLANVARIVAERDRLARLLAEIDYLRPYPSHANFILCRVIGREAREVRRALEERGILVRYFNKPGLTDCIRISVGRPEDTDRLMIALREIGRGEPNGGER